MSYTINSFGTITRDDDGAFIPADPDNADYAAFLKWKKEGNEAATPASDPNALQATLTQAIQTMLDAKAQAYNYDTITTAVTYADEPAVEKFQTEGRAFRQWRSDTWAAAYAYLADVAAGKKPFPNVSDLPSLLPPFPLDT
jgi:hypothetical protein